MATFLETTELSESEENKNKLIPYEPGNLHEVLPEEKSNNFNISNITYTSQIGREDMEDRLALIVDSVEDLRDKLKSFVIEEEIEGDIYRGQVRRNKDVLAVFEADEDMSQIIDI